MDKHDLLGTAQIAGGTYLGYQGIKHGLPRSLGIRTEYHTTSKTNANLIKKSGNILDPAFGGKNGWAEAIKSEYFMDNSKNFVHITGIHKDAPICNKMPAKAKPFLPALRTVARSFQNFMYKTVGNGCYEDLRKVLNIKSSGKKEALNSLWKSLKTNALHDKTKKFYIPGIDSYFNNNFIPDTDDLALKSSKKVKVYTNKFSAMTAGLKEFGLKGMKENKGRVAFGIGLLSLGAYAGLKLIDKGIQNLSK